MSDAEMWTSTERRYLAQAQFVDALLSGAGIYDDMPQNVKDAIAHLEQRAAERRAKRAKAAEEQC